MQKKVKVDRDRVIYYGVADAGQKIYQIRDVCNDRFGVVSCYYFKMGKNFEIGGYTVDDRATDLFFEIDSNHPLYLSFVDTLLDDDELIIDDDRVKENNRRYLKVYKNGEKVILQFVNNLTNDKSRLSNEKFSIFIKGIEYDPNSKIDQRGLDTKERLYDFFSDIHCLMMDEELEKGHSYVKKKD